MGKNKKIQRSSAKAKNQPTVLAWLSRQAKKRWVRIVGSTLAVLIFLTVTADWWNPLIFPPVKDPNYGVSFSVKRARELDLDPHAVLTALLDDMKIKNYRLMSYWDEIEGQRGTFDFSELDWQIEQVAKRGGTVSLAIGLRQPRWPECHQPEWAGKLTGNAWKQALYAFMEIVAKRYENNPTVISWQLENEGVNNWFGTCDRADRERLFEEFDLLKSWSKKPIWMSLSDQHGYPVNQPIPDKFGYSVYRWVWNDKTPPFNGYLLYPTPIWYHRLRAVIITATTGKEIFIHELQLEPWGPIDTKYLSVNEQNKSMSTEQIGKSLLFARMIGKKDIYVWGGEWWYWRREHGDASIWNTVKADLAER